MISYKDDIASLASKLNYGENEFMRVVAEAHKYYRPFHIVTIKKDGKKKVRHIDNPYKKLPLRSLQIAIKKELLNSQASMLDKALVGGIKKRSMMSHLEPHIGKSTVVCMDLSNCFPNISEKRVFEVWKDQLGYSAKLAELLTKATTYRGYLPQGAPTSSMLCNFALNPMAKEIRELLEPNDVSYTQYIDDICFSGDDQTVRRMVSEVHHITYSYDQKINRSKTEIMDTKHKQRSMGIVVNAKTKVDSVYVEKVIKRIMEEASTGYISSGMKISITGQILHIKKYDVKSGNHLEELFNKKISDVYDGIMDRQLNGEIKTCWQYRLDRTGRKKCRYLSL